MTRDRLVDEMVLVLLDRCDDFGNEQTCIDILFSAGYRGHVIHEHIDEARETARKTRRDEIEAWNSTQFK